MDLPPSKLSGAASKLWSENANQFHKKTDIKIDLGLNKLHSTCIEKNDERASSSFSTGYVFGSRVAERVTITKSDTDDNNKSDVGSQSSKNGNEDVSKSIDVSSIFKRTAEKNTRVNSTNLWKTSNATLSSENNTGSTSLEESASALAKKASQHSVEDEKPQQEITTGEEDEMNLLHISCKFYQFNTETKAWQERGMGSLKLNQHISSDNVRLVGRQSGSQRVLINSKIFPEMLLEELNEKRVKISALTNDSDLPQLFLIQASPASVANLHSALRKYIEASAITKTANTLRKRRLGASECYAAEEEGTTKKFVSEQQRTEDEEEDSSIDEEEEE